MTSAHFNNGESEIGVWECCASPGEPLCVGDMSDKGLSINLYYDEGGIYGVDIFEQGGTEPVAAYGYVSEGEAAL
jgi:hypothetical protein